MTIYSMGKPITNAVEKKNGVAEYTPHRDVEANLARYYKLTSLEIGQSFRVPYEERRKIYNVMKKVSSKFKERKAGDDALFTRIK